MTLSIRNGLLTLAFSVLLALTLGYGLLSFVLVGREGWQAQVGQGSLFRLCLETAAAPLSALIGFLVVRRSYRKSAAPEAFFFSLFLATLAGESLLLAQAWLTFAAWPSYFTAVLTRVVWAFRFTGLFLLLCGSLYAFDFAFRKFGNLVAFSAAAGVFLASLLPLHSTSARNHLLFAVGDAPGMVLVTTLLGTVVAVNFLVGSLRAEASERARWRAWGALLFLAGWSLAIVIGPWATVVAVPGAVMVSWKAEQNLVLA